MLHLCNECWNQSKEENFYKMFLPEIKLKGWHLWSIWSLPNSRKQYLASKFEHSGQNLILCLSYILLHFNMGSPAEPATCWKCLVAQTATLFLKPHCTWVTESSHVHGLLWNIMFSSIHVWTVLSINFNLSAEKH